MQEAGIEINENHPIKPVDAGLLGFNHEWAGQITVCGIPNAAGYNPNVVTKLAGRLPLPLNRMSGTPSQKFDWKGAIGPYEQRTEQDLADWWTHPQKIGLGTVEWIQMVQAIDPSARFTWTINLYESPQDAADLVEFLTGDGSNPNGGTNWAQLRIDYGIPDPVPVDLWELGNEMDGSVWRDDFQNLTTYTDLCKEFIAAIRAVQPEAIIAAHVGTMSSYPDYLEFFGVPWREWHRNVLREIGDDIDYLAFHCYYNSMPSSFFENLLGMIENDISDIMGSDRIKIYMSEHGWWPLPRSEWPDNWFHTHSLMGSLGTADWMTRLMNSPAVEIAGYHSFVGGPWRLIDKASDGSHFTTGIADLHALLHDAFADGVSIVPVNVSGPNTDRTNPQCMFTASALTTSDGVNLILVNRSDDVVRNVSLTLKRQYVLSEKTVFTAPELLSHHTEADRPITVTRTTWPSGEPLKNIIVPDKSVVILKLRANYASTDFNAYTAPHTLTSGVGDGTNVQGSVVLQDSATAGTFTVWGSARGVNTTYDARVLGDNTGSNFLRLHTALNGGGSYNVLSQVSTTQDMSLSDNWGVFSRFSAIPGNGSLYFGLYAGGAMNSHGGYNLDQILTANSTNAAPALQLILYNQGSVAVTRTGTANIQEFWNRDTSSWQTHWSAAGVSAVVLNGTNQYDLSITTDGTNMNLLLTDAISSAVIADITSALSDLGTNITTANSARFSAGDIGNNTVDGWKVDFYTLALQSAPAVYVDLDAYTPPAVISAAASSGTTINDHSVLLDTSARGEFTVWGSTGVTGSYSIDVLSDNYGSNVLSLVSARTNGNPVAQVSTTEARSLSDRWAVKSVFALEKQEGVSGRIYSGLYGGAAMNSIGGYQLNQISSPNTDTAAAALQLAVDSSGEAYVTRTGLTNMLEYWTGNSWSSSSTSVLSNLDVNGTTLYSLALSSDGVVLNMGLTDETGNIPLVNVISLICDLGSNITTENTVRFSAGDIGSNTTYKWFKDIYGLAVSKTPVTSVDFSKYSAPDTILSGTTTGTTTYKKKVLNDTGSSGMFTVYGSGSGTDSVYSAKIVNDIPGGGVYLRLEGEKGTSAYNLMSQVSMTSAKSLAGNWGVKTRFSPDGTGGNGSYYVGLYGAGLLSNQGGTDYRNVLSTDWDTGATAVGLSIAPHGVARISYTASDNKLRYWDGSGWVGGGLPTALTLDTTGATIYDLSLTTDGEHVRMVLMNTNTSTTLFDQSVAISDLGSNVTTDNLVRFSAGDIAQNSGDDWTAFDIHLLSISTISEVNEIVYFE